MGRCDAFQLAPTTHGEKYRARMLPEHCHQARSPSGPGPTCEAQELSTEWAPTAELEPSYKCGFQEYTDFH